MRFLPYGLSLFLSLFPVISQAGQNSSSPADAFGQHIEVDGTRLFIWQSGCEQQARPHIVMVSGPTDNWNSDTAWFALLQPLIAREYCVWSIERPGHGFSDSVAEPSYKHFAKLLNSLAAQESLSSVTLIAFASSNLSVHHLYANDQSADWLSGAILIDPDVLTDHAINQYANDAKPYREKQQLIEDFILSGKNDQRVNEVAEAELKHVKEIIPSQFKQYTNWDYYHALVERRKSHDGQLGRTRELANYHSDLASAQKITLPDDLPLVIINTDFENRFIRNKEDNAGLIQWRDEGDRWMQNLTKAKHRFYVHLTTEEHLLTLSDPQAIIDAITMIEAVNWVEQDAKLSSSAEH